MSNPYVIGGQRKRDIRDQSIADLRQQIVRCRELRDTRNALYVQIAAQADWLERNPEHPKHQQRVGILASRRQELERTIRAHNAVCEALEGYQHWTEPKGMGFVHDLIRRELGKIDLSERIPF